MSTNLTRTVGARFWCALLCSFFVDVLFVGAASAAPQFPTLSGRVVDAANLLDANIEQQLSTQLAQFEQDSSIQLVVVTLPDLQGYPVEDYGYQLGRHWGIGEKGKNNGVLLIVAPQDRALRIEVGYGLEGTLTDALSSNIINAIIVPNFKRGAFADGIVQGAQAIQAALTGEYQPKPVRAKKSQRPPLGVFLFFGLIVLLMMFGGGGRRGGFFPGGFGGGGLGGGGFGGGGFGGGGGSFGGGGASGSW
ncbi:MAG: TPM domain-containing protein [Spongiibacteraceae bacterium]